MLASIQPTSKNHIRTDLGIKPDSERRGNALTIQLTNPKAALTWIAIISLGITNETPGWVALVIVAGTSFLSIVMHLLYAIAFSTQTMVKLYSKSRRSIQAALGTFFAFAGIRLLVSQN